jgi:hypothetical protein
MKSGDHHEYRDRRDRAIFHRRRDCDAAPLAIQAAFTQELARSRIATTVSFPWSDRTVSLTLPF